MSTGVRLYPKQEKLVNAIRQAYKDGAKMPCVQASTGFGKCHEKGTEILMYSGLVKKVEDIVQGDEVMGPDSSPRNVLKLCRGVDEMYRITPVKGESFTVNKTHTLSLMISGSKTKVADCNGITYLGGSIVNITVEDYLKCNDNFKHLAKVYRSGVEFKESYQSIDPYILGLWLADGTATKPTITSMDEEAIEYWTKYATGFDNTSVRVEAKDNNSKASAYHITRTKKHSQSVGENVFNIFKSANILGNKHVPNEYKIASREQRLDFLAGMLDGDGNLVGGCVFEITQKKKDMADDIAFIARSLGMAAYVSEKTGTIKSIGFSGTYYRVTISGDTDEIPNKIERKKAKPRRQVKNPLVTGFSVEHVGRGDYYGFEVDRDHLYLMADFTVTHNSVVAGYIIRNAIDKGAKRVVMLVDSLTLIDQLIETLENKFGLDVGVIQGFNSRYDMSKRVQIATPQTLTRRFADENAGRFYREYDVSLIIIDECFVGDTLIDTPRGKRKIQDMSSGDIVYNGLGTGEVIAKSVKTTRKIIKMELSNGKQIRCTENHPFFTDEGWKKAGQLEVGSRLFSRENLSIMLEDLHPENGISEWSVGGKRVRTGLDKKIGLLSVLLEEAEEPYGQSEINRQDEKNSCKDWSQAEGSRRKWKGNDGKSESSARRFGARVGGGVCSDYRSESLHGDEDASPLQDRLGEQGKENSDRGGRLFSLHQSEAGAGQEEGLVSGDVRVESYTIEESGGDTLVYNLQVSGHPSYYANGVLAHNCHIRHRGIDEAIEHWKCRGMGLTATPLAKGMANTYDALVKADSLDELIADGDLAEYRVFSHPASDFKGCKVSQNGDIQAESVFTDEVIGDVFETWRGRASDRLTIGFAPTIAKCEAFAQLFRDKGVSSIAIHSKLTSEDSNDILDRYKAGEIRVLWSVAKLIKGFDVPESSCLIDCQPTKSLMRHVQKIGRVLRKFEGKEFAIINDHAGNMQRNGFVEDVQIDELSDGSEKDSKDRKDATEPQPIPCPKCGAMLRPVISICPECGHERIAKSKREEPDSIETGAGELVEMKKSSTKRNREYSWDDKIAFASGLRGYAQSKGYKEGWFAHKYKEFFGVWPNDKRVKSAPPSEASEQVKKFIQHINIKAAKAKP